MLQLVRGGPESVAHVVVHVPLKQFGCVAGHTLPHRPQFLGFVLMSTQVVPQVVRGEQVAPSRTVTSFRASREVPSRTGASAVASFETPVSFDKPASRPSLAPSGSAKFRSKADRPPHPAAPIASAPIVQTIEAKKSRTSFIVHLVRVASRCVLGPRSPMQLGIAARKTITRSHPGHPKLGTLDDARHPIHAPPLTAAAAGGRTRGWSSARRLRSSRAAK
jgi:hypothetical protein